VTARIERSEQPLRRDLLVTGVALGAGFTILMAFLALFGFDVAAALGALWRGALGSPDAVLSATLVRAVPLAVLALAFAIAARGGAFNIGMEGQLTAGAIAATWVGLGVGGMAAPWAPLLVLAAGVAAGALWMVVPVVLRARFGVTEVITTLLLNFVAEALVSYAVTGPLQEGAGTYPQSDPIAMAARLPRLLAGYRLHWGAVVVLGLVVALAVAARRSRAAFSLKAVGDGPVAAALTGRIHVSRTVTLALLASGAVAGLAGAIEITGVSHALYQRITPGYGFTAIAVALLGRLHPVGIVFAALLFGALEAGAGAMQRDAGIPAVAALVVQATVLLALVVAARRRA
jgi:simple sugar transport system permease protein